MRYVIPATGSGTLDDEVAKYFGQAENFVIVFEKKGKLAVEEVIPNRPSGIQFAEQNTALIAASDKDVNVAIADRMADDTQNVLRHAGVKVALGYGDMSLRAAVKKFVKSELKRG